MGTETDSGQGEGRLKPYDRALWPDCRALPSAIGRYRLFDLLVAGVTWYDNTDEMPETIAAEPPWVTQARAIIAEAKGEGK